MKAQPRKERPMRIRRQKVWCDAIGAWFVLRNLTKRQAKAYVADLNAKFGPHPIYRANSGRPIHKSEIRP